MITRDKLENCMLEFCGLLMGIMLCIPLIGMACWYGVRDLFACFIPKGLWR